MARSHSGAQASGLAADLPDAPVAQRIVAEATRLFAERGYAGASTAEIVTAAGVTKPMVYYYFGDKAGLFRAVIEQLNARLRRGFASIEAADQSAAEALGSVAELMFEITRDSATASRLQFASYYGPGEGDVSRTLEAGPTETHEVLRRIAQRGVDAGAFRGEIADIAFAVQGAINIRIMAKLHHPEAVQLPEGEGRRIVGQLLAGFTA